jgi:hypothetical protein
VNEIRVCASSPPFVIVMTWYWNGEVWILNRETGDEAHITTIRTLDEFNAFLYEWEIQPVGMGRTGKREEKQHAVLMERLPF